MLFERFGPQARADFSGAAEQEGVLLSRDSSPRLHAPLIRYRWRLRSLLLGNLVHRESDVVP